MNAMNWLAMQLAWEQRLTELRIERPTPWLAKRKAKQSGATAAKAA